MRKTLMLSAAALGLAIGAPAFAQTAATATQAPARHVGHRGGYGFGHRFGHGFGHGFRRRDADPALAPRPTAPACIAGMQAQKGSVPAGPCAGRRQFRAGLEPGEQHRPRRYAERDRAAPAGAGDGRQCLARAAARRGPAGAPPRHGPVRRRRRWSVPRPARSTVRPWPATRASPPRAPASRRSVRRGAASPTTTWPARNAASTAR